MEQTSSDELDVPDRLYAAFCRDRRYPLRSRARAFLLASSRLAGLR